MVNLSQFTTESSFAVDGYFHFHVWQKPERIKLPIQSGIFGRNPSMIRGPRSFWTMSQLFGKNVGPPKRHGLHVLSPKTRENPVVRTRFLAGYCYQSCFELGQSLIIIHHPSGKLKNQKKKQQKSRVRGFDFFQSAKESLRLIYGHQIMGMMMMMMMMNRWILKPFQTKPPG